MDIEALKKQIALRGYNVVNFSDAVKIDRSTFYRRLSGNGCSFTIEEVKRMKNVLKLDEDSAAKIFL